MASRPEPTDLGGKQPGGAPSGPPKDNNNQPKRPTNNNAKGKGGTGNSTSGFRGDTEKMKGFVFELPTRDSQMTDTLDMLKRYVRTTYTSAPAMGTLFLRVPTAPAVISTVSKRSSRQQRHRNPFPGTGSRPRRLRQLRRGDSQESERKGTRSRSHQERR